MSDVKAQSRLAKAVHIVDADRKWGPLQLVINQGARHGIKLGDRFLVFGNGPHIADPDTGADLGPLELVRRQGEVVHVQEQMATIRTTERSRRRPARRLIRDPAMRAALGVALSGIVAPASVVEEELNGEDERAFDSVQLGDLAKPI